MSLRKQNIPFLLGPRDAQQACLLIHGFGGSAEEMRGLGESLAARGMRVCGLALAGHSGAPEDLVRSRYTEWIASAETGLAKLVAFPQVYAVGLSMGGMLSLMLAARYPQQVSGVVAMATPTHFARDWQVLLVRPVMKWFYPYKMLDLRDPSAQAIYLSSLASLEPPSIDFSDPQVVAEIKATRLSLDALGELALLLAQGRSAISNVRCPLLVIHSKLDKAAEPACAEEIMRLATRASRKSLHWLERSNHVITNGPERDEVFRLVGEFIARDANS